MVTQTVADLQQDFYLTFGVQYSHEPHPHWKGANPDGWVTIQAETHEEARRLALACFGRNFCTTYDHLSFNPPAMMARFYPLGCLAVININGGGKNFSYVPNVDPPTAHLTEEDWA